MTSPTDLSSMVRPWYRGIDTNARNFGDHIYADCEWLAEEGEPREGVGWLNPHDDEVCEECLRRYDPEAYERRLSHEH